jgi:hypothetical protein
MRANLRSDLCVAGAVSARILVVGACAIPVRHPNAPPQYAAPVRVNILLIIQNSEIYW